MSGGSHTAAEKEALTGLVQDYLDPPSHAMITEAIAGPAEPLLMPAAQVYGVTGRAGATLAQIRRRNPNDE